MSFIARGMLICVLATLLAAQPAHAQAPATEADALRGEFQRLRAYSAELLRQVETLRADLAASEKARKQTDAVLESVTKRLREQLDEKQTNYAKETVRREKEVSTTRQELDSAKVQEARQTARAAELEKAVGELRTAVVRREEERKKLEGEIADLSRARDEATRSQASKVAERDQAAKQLADRLAAVEQERKSRAAELEEQQKQLAAARQDLDAMKAAREHDAGRANGLAAELERLLGRHLLGRLTAKLGDVRVGRA